MAATQPDPTPEQDSSLRALASLPAAELRRRLRQDAGHTAQWVYQAACAGLVEAQTTLGQMLLDGRGTPADAGAARRWFARAAVSGYAPAANMLGRCLERGWGGAIDLPQAGEHYRAAALAGLDWGQYNLANMLLRGRGMPCDVAQAFGWFVAAAEQGHAKAMNLVGRFHEEGWLAPADPANAAVWYRRAAVGGDFRGQHNLATVLAQAGLLSEAVTWFTLAGESGSLDFRRVAADQLLGDRNPALRSIGLRIAARSCVDGDAQDFHRYGVALAQGPVARPHLAAAWLRKAVQMGHPGAQSALDAIEAAVRRPARAGLWSRVLARLWPRGPATLHWALVRR